MIRSVHSLVSLTNALQLSTKQQISLVALQVLALLQRQRHTPYSSILLASNGLRTSTLE